MAKKNKNYKEIQSNYLFSEIEKKVKDFLLQNPKIKIYRLGIGNTTKPLTKSVISKMREEVTNLSGEKTYSGYGDEQGNKELRQAIVNTYAKRNINLNTDEIFISDGAKPDTANIQSIFSEDSVIAVQNPVYPVYVDSSLLSGRKNIVYLPAMKKNNFIPSIPRQHVDVIYLCSPNNPTGAVATRKQLKEFVDYARSHKTVIIFDAAYEAFIQEKNIPHSIYEIPQALTCAIEINSFSKYAGFTGVRLGWTVVPNQLVVEDTKPGELNRMWHRRQTTMFNGASNIAQAGGIAALSNIGEEECKETINYYMQNARLILASLQKIGLETFGGVNAPYIWVKTPNNESSWNFFNFLLEKAHVVVTPGVGFGSLGEGYIRISAFGKRSQITQAIKKLEGVF